MNNHIIVLREMMNIAENRRAEMKEILNTITKYNLALIAFSGSFLSVLVTADLKIPVVQISGFFSLASIGISLFTIRPKAVRSTLLIHDDIMSIRSGENIVLEDFLLITAELTEQAANALYKRTYERKTTTIISATCLAISLISTYLLFIYA